MPIQSKSDFIKWCLRELGAPLVQINVTDEQIDDRYTEGLRMFNDYHYNGYSREYVKYQLTDQDISNGYIPLPDRIIGVSKVFPFLGLQYNGSYIFDINYQIRLNDLWDLSSSTLSYYVNVREYTNMLDQLFNGRPMYRFNRVQDRVYLDIAATKLVAGQWIVLETMRALTPEDFPQIWDEPWLKQYITALIKRQWGSNLKKFNGISLIGGVSIDGQGLYEEALQEIQQLEEELRNTYEEPVGFLVG